MERFWRRYGNPGAPLLVGFSGGPDSTCLLHLLLELDADLHVAHVDHSWRPESAEEAKSLSSFADSLSLPFHSVKLSPPGPGNAEACAREARLLFFQEISSKIGAQAVALGHHLNDQAETVLKRVLEGAPLAQLGGLEKVRRYRGIMYWRPLLDVSRGQIMQYLEEKKLSYLEDRTNQDRKYLRTRLRRDVFPFLTEVFGKEISSPLCQIGRDSTELEGYLDRKVAWFLPEIREVAGGVLFDFSRGFPEEVIESKHLLRSLFRIRGLSIPREILLDLIRFLASSHETRVLKWGRTEVRIKGRGFLVISN